MKINSVFGSCLHKLNVPGIVSATVLSLVTTTANAAVIWDYSPATVGGSLSSISWNNESGFQNFAEQVSFGDPMRLDGIDIYSDLVVSTVGTPVVVRV